MKARTVEDHVRAFGNHALEVDPLAWERARHPLEVVDEGFLAVADARVVLDIRCAGMSLDRLPGPAVVEHQLIEREDVLLVAFEVVRHAFLRMRPQTGTGARRHGGQNLRLAFFHSARAVMVSSVSQCSARAAFDPEPDIAAPPDSLRPISASGAARPLFRRTVSDGALTHLDTSPALPLQHSPTRKVSIHACPLHPWFSCPPA
ncbi:MAG: hypothetical protein JWQ76_4447 [Ramlibacter sp.]|nr:hypothetical protein [Ramlibacter sp.]